MNLWSGEGDGTALLQDLHEARYGERDRAYNEWLTDAVRRDTLAARERRGYGRTGRRAADIVGQRFGSLVVTARDGVDAQGYARWDCICDCGRPTKALGLNLRARRKKSCGCARVRQGLRLAMLNRKAG